MTPEIDLPGEPELRTVVAFALAPGVAVGGLAFSAMRRRRHRWWR